AGPTTSKPGQVIGSCGPTTSSRMEPYLPILLKYGLKGFIGKGKISEETKRALKRYKGIYFVTFGGAGAYLSERIKKCEPVAYKNLGTEAIFKLEIKDFPAIVWELPS
ncbi:MAG: fumarate hydratase C-terminal domain-containing protein, partial [Endomicrobiia bacterium]